MGGSKLADPKSQTIDNKINTDRAEEISQDSSIVEEVEQKSENTTDSKIKGTESSSSVLTENLSSWRAAAYHHVEICRAKYIKEFGKDIHLHSDDSDTMIKLKEKITPICAQITDKERIRKKHKKVSKSVPSAFDEWLQKKNKKLKKQKMQTNKEREINEIRKAAEEAKKQTNRTNKAEKWRKERERIENEKKAIEKIKAREKSEKQYITNLTSNEIPPTEWEKIRQAAEDMKHIEPLKLGRLEGQGNKDPGKYLTKYVVQPDSAFRARYKHILEADAARPSEIILDGDHEDGIDDPAELPKQFKQMLLEEARKLKECRISATSWVKKDSEVHTSFESIFNDHRRRPTIVKKSKPIIFTHKKRRESRPTKASNIYSKSCPEKYDF